MIDRQSLLAQLLMGPPQPATRLSQLAGAPPSDPVDAMRASLPPMATPDTRAGRPNRLAELTMPSPMREDRQSTLARLLNTPGIEAALTMTPVVGDVASLGYAVRDASRGDWWGAGLNALGVLPLVPGMAGMVRGVDKAGDTMRSVPVRTLQGGRNALPVEVVADLKRAGHFDILPGGHVRAYQPWITDAVLDQDARSRIASALMEKFEPRMNVFFRMTDNPDEIALASSRRLRPSMNHVERTREAGVSVAESPHYAAFGYKNGYMVRGKVVGRGSDGEPLLDPRTIEVIGDMVPASKLEDHYNAWRAPQLRKALSEMGWTEEQYRAALQFTEGMRSDDFMNLLR